jgi:WD40 repeat protein/tetratricopeptide (TPR) repeat protein
MDHNRTERLAANPPRAVPAPATHTDAVAGRLWERWQKGERPEVDAFLADAGPLAPAQVVGVLRVDMHERWRIGEGPPASDYFARHRELAGHPEAFALIADELLFRQERSEVVALDEYCRKYPQYAERLRQQVQGQSAASCVTIRPMTKSLPPRAGPGGAPSDAGAQPTGDWLNIDVSRGAARAGSTPAPTEDWIKLRPASADQTPERAGATSAQAPSRVGNYAIVRELGRGGMGVVFQAQDTQLNRLVALKMILAAEYADREALLRFQAEAKAVARLQHPHIVQIYEIGEEQGRPYFALEYLDGGTLRANTKGLPQPPRVAASIVRPLAEAIHYAHRQGIIHRDLKPANILLTADGVPKITDFGLAKSATSQATLAQQETNAPGLTKSGDMLGTPSYMAPEQVEAKLGAITPATDVYALGAILYELLTGQPPFVGPTPLDTILQVLDRDPVPVTRLQPKTPRDLATICAKCLNKEPKKRYASGKSLAADLQRFLQGEPVLARRTGWTERTWKWARRRPAVAALLALLLLTVIGAFAGISWQLVETTQARDAARLEEAKSTAALEKAETNFYFGNIAQAGLQWRTNNVAGAENLLDRCQANRRGWEWHYRKGLDHADLATIPDAHLTNIYGLAFSPDGRLLASGGCQPYVVSPRGGRPGDVRFWDAATGAAQGGFVAHRELFSALAFSPDSRRVATCARDGVVKVWDVATRQCTLECAGHKQEWLTAVAFRPDGKRLASAAMGDGVREWDAATGQEVLPQISYRNGVRSLAYSHDSRWLLALGDDGLRLWDANTHEQIRHFEVRQGQYEQGGGSISPDGRFVAATSGLVVRIWETATGRLVQVLGGHDARVMSIAFSPDGQLLASGSSDQTVRIWVVATGAEQLCLRGHRSRVQCVAFHPNGRCVASAAQQPGDIKIWDITRQQECANCNSPVVNLAFAPDPRQVFVLTELDQLQSIDAATGVVQSGVRVAHDVEWLVQSCRAAFSGDCRRLAVVEKQDKRVVRLVEVPSAKDLRALGPVGPEGGRVVHLTWSRDGRRLAARAISHQPQVQVWEAESGQPLANIMVTPVRGINLLTAATALSPDGTLVACDDYAGGPHIKICAASGGTTQVTLPCGNSPLQCAAFAPDGKLLAAGDAEGHVYLWHVGTWRPAGDQPLQARQGQCELAFDPSGARLAGVDRDQVTVWETAAGQEVLVLRGAPSRSLDSGFNPRVTWSSDGTKLAAYNWDVSFSIWDAADSATAAGKQALREAAAGRAFDWHLRGLERAAEASPWAEDFHARQLLTLDPPSLALRRERCFTLLRLGREADAADDFAECVRQNPDDSTIWRNRARCRLAAGAWDKARADYATCFERTPTYDIGDWWYCATLRLLANDQPGYRRLCQSLVERRVARDNPDWSWLVACILTEAPGASIDQRLAEEQSALALAKHPDDDARLFVAGLVHLRAGRNTAAIEVLTKQPADAARWPGRGARLEALALAQLAQGDANQARATHEEAQRWLAEITRGQPEQRAAPEGIENGWWLMFQLFQHEAKASLAKPAPASAIPK